MKFKKNPLNRNLNQHKSMLVGYRSAAHERANGETATIVANAIAAILAQNLRDKTFVGVMSISSIDR